MNVATDPDLLVDLAGRLRAIAGRLVTRAARLDARVSAPLAARWRGAAADAFLAREAVRARRARRAGELLERAAAAMLTAAAALAEARSVAAQAAVLAGAGADPDAVRRCQACADERSAAALRRMDVELSTLAAELSRLTAALAATPAGPGPVAPVAAGPGSAGPGSGWPGRFAAAANALSVVRGAALAPEVFAEVAAARAATSADAAAVAAAERAGDVVTWWPGTRTGAALRTTVGELVPALGRVPLLGGLAGAVPVATAMLAAAGAPALAAGGHPARDLTSAAAQWVAGEAAFDGLAAGALAVGLSGALPVVAAGAGALLVGYGVGKGVEWTWAHGDDIVGGTVRAARAVGSAVEEAADATDRAARTVGSGVERAAAATGRAARSAGSAVGRAAGSVGHGAEAAWRWAFG